MIILTEKAKEQLDLIKKYDFTLENFYLRIKISGKHCYGFSYEFVLTQEPLDVTYPLGSYELVMDSFTAQYFKKGSIDFRNHEFVVINEEEINYHGKFFLKQ